ncbi:poly(U)-specific endoribonuclease-B-like [Hibiscus syriacus]|uniref:Poly(U)-specific endoribonuclease-B-like n=1 Tax=Hibiscus syriacus TaxID=106335 RepID=A0A6A2XSK5_HIBSY|nr:FCS-Like Zinc finger 1-like [Hibiscus syriacus]KAE8678488.1 poly(U)-specific endoribonuclease-B-like [Hibiscus syriacus]
MEYSGSSSRPCFIEEDDGLASLADMEAGYSGTHYHGFNQNGFFSRRTSLRNLTSSSSCSRFVRFYDGRFEDHQPHFLDACFLCKNPLGANRDIFMYRGDTPFCSEECRQEEIETDEAMEKNRDLSSSMKLSINKEQRKSKSSNKAQDYSFITGTVAAA